jgi:muramidase (phage lysozyme)
VDETNSAAQLIQALSGFGSATANFFAEKDEQAKQDDQLQAGYDAMKSSAKTWAEAVQANPDLASKSPFYRDTFMSNLAQTSMSKRIGEVQAAYYTSPLVNSTNPGEIQSWFIKQIEGDLSQYTDPAERRAAMEVASNAARAFSEAHARNAKDNLVRKAREASGARNTERLDAFEALPAAQPYEAGEFAAKDLDPMEQALLAGIGAGESGHRYDIRYDGGKGATFELNGQHPNIAAVITSGKNAGKTSTAAGRYQFLYSTWVDLWKSQGKEPPPFTPENQDKAAILLAKRDYKDRTGRDLMEDLKTEGFSNRIMNGLQGTWEAFQKAGRPRYAATYNAVLKKAGMEAPDSITADPNLDELQTSLYADAAKDVAGGIREEDADADIVKSVINKAMESGDERYLKILDVKREGRPAISDDPDTRKAIMATANSIAALRVTRDNAQRELQEREHKARVEKFKAGAYIAQEEAMIAGKDALFKGEQIIEAAKVDHTIAAQMRAMNETLRSQNKNDDPKAILDFQTRLYNGEITPDDVRDAVAAGYLRDPSNIGKFMEQARQNKQQSFLNGTPYRDAMSTIHGILMDPNNFDLEKARVKVEAEGEVFEAFTKWMQENPKALPEDQKRFLNGTLKAILGEKADIDAWKAQKATTPPPGTNTPAETTKPSTDAAAAPVVTPSTDYRTTKLFTDTKSLDALFAEHRANPAAPNAFKEAIDKLGLKDPKAIARFYQTQRALTGTK